MASAHTSCRDFTRAAAHRCPARQPALQPAQPCGRPAPPATCSPTAAPGAKFFTPLSRVRRGGVVSASRNGLTLGLNQSADEGDHKPDIDASFRGKAARFVANLYDWGVRSTNERDMLNTREPAPLTTLDKVSLVLVRGLQTVIMLALAWHVWSWVSTSVAALVWRYHIAGVPWAWPPVWTWPPAWLPAWLA